MIKQRRRKHESWEIEVKHERYMKEIPKSKGSLYSYWSRLEWKDGWFQEKSLSLKTVNERLFDKFNCRKSTEKHFGELLEGVENLTPGSKKPNKWKNMKQWLTPGKNFKCKKKTHTI